MYHYRCPNCGAALELRQRVTQSKRKCPKCQTPIVTEVIDEQKQAQTAAMWRAGCAVPVFVLLLVVIAMGLLRLGTAGIVVLLVGVLVLGVGFAVREIQR
jgi:putative FmdB family regulatory protein